MKCVKMNRTINNFLIPLLMWLFWLIQLSGSLNTDKVVLERHTRGAPSWRALDASKRDNKRYERLSSYSLEKTFNKVLLSPFSETLDRDKRAVGSDGNQTINLSLHNISDNNLSEFLKEITNPSQVTGLNLSMNHLRQLKKSTFIMMPYLSALDMSQNQLSTIDDAAELTKLTTLNVSHNNLYKFATVATLLLLPTSANNNHNVIHMNLSAASSISSIQVLDLSCNKFNSSRNIVLYNLNNLQMLDLSCNELTTIDRNLFFNLSQLHNLDLSYNRVSELRANTFVYLMQLQVLNLSNNNISFIQNDTFITMPNLEYLDVSNNFIRANSIHALQGIPDLVALSLANNEELRESLQGFVATWSLKEMDGSGTGLCSIPAALTQSVRILKLVDNYLQVIRCGDLDSYPLLQHLILSSNLISDIEDDALGRLEIIETLYLNDNQLKRIPISLPSSLIDLHLENNLITEIQPQVLTGLKTLALLNLSGNKIIYLPGLPLPRLSRLNMRSCELESVNQELVKMSPYLRDLYLEGNPIRCADLLGIAEWATPCRESNGETAESIVVSTANDYFIHKWHSHACKTFNHKEKVIDKKQKINNKLCKEVIRVTTPKNNNKNIASVRTTTASAVPTASMVVVTREKINDNNYFTGNKGSERDGVVVADNKLIERQSSLSQQRVEQQSKSENQETRQQKPDKNVNDKFEHTDTISKHDNNVNDDDEQTMTLKRNNNTININETNVGEEKQTSKANITESPDKLPYNSNNNNNGIKTTKKIAKTEQIQEFRKTVLVEENNQIVAKKLIFDTSTQNPIVLSTTNNNHNIDKDQLNVEKVQTNDVNHPIKLAKQSKKKDHWRRKSEKLPDHVINMSSTYSKTGDRITKVTKVTKNKTKIMAITNDDDYLNDDNKAVVDNFVTIPSTRQVEVESLKKGKKSLEAKQLSLHFNFTKIHPTFESKKASSIPIYLLSTTTTTKPYTDRTNTVTQTTHNKINLDKHVQLNRKVNVLQGNVVVPNNNNGNVIEGEYQTMTNPQQTEPQQLQHSQTREPHQTLNAMILSNENLSEGTSLSPVSSKRIEVPSPQKQEWSDIRPNNNDDDVTYPSHSYLGHPGLFMVIGTTLGMALAFGFVHLYKCQKMRHWQHEQVDRYGDSISDISTINTPTHNHRRCHRHNSQYHDLLPMDVLNNTGSHCTTTTKKLNVPSTTVSTTSLMMCQNNTMERMKTTTTTPNSPIELW